MDEMIRVLDAAISCCSAKENMKKVVGYMESEPMNLIEMVTMQALLDMSQEENAVSCIAKYDFVFAENKEVLEAMGVTAQSLLKEADEMLFMRMFLRYLHKNRKKIFILAESQELLELLLEYAQKRYGGMKIVGMASMEEHGISDDMIVNKINGTETDCIMAFLTSPFQEQFALRNKSLLNARMWLGLGTDVKDKLAGSLIKTKLKSFFARQFLKKKIKEEKKKL